MSISFLAGFFREDEDFSLRPKTHSKVANDKAFRRWCEKKVNSRKGRQTGVELDMKYMQRFFLYGGSIFNQLHYNILGVCAPFGYVWQVHFQLSPDGWTLPVGTSSHDYDPVLALHDHVNCRLSGGGET